MGEPSDVFLGLLPNPDRFAAASGTTSRDTNTPETGLIRTGVDWSLRVFSMSNICFTIARYIAEHLLDFHHPTWSPRLHHDYHLFLQQVEQYWL